MSNVRKLHDVMEQLVAKQDEIVLFIPKNKPIYYIDIPVHFNIGDLLINRGADFFFKRYNYKVVARASLFDYQAALKDIPDDATIVLHGGGNFGDIWPHHEKVRQAVLKKFTKNKIVLMPQSIHFHDPANIRVLKRAYREHPDITLLLRDKISLDIALEHFSEKSYLMPDIAHQLWPEDALLLRHIKGQGDLYLAREDREANNAFKDSLSSRKTVDWDSIPNFMEKTVLAAIRMAMMGNPSRSLQALLIKRWLPLRDRLIARAAHFMAAYDHIITDRLHAMLLGLMLDKRVTMLDNSYGKLGRYADAWLHDIMSDLKAKE
jgi:pyruvyl transferase EpsO